MFLSGVSLQHFRNYSNSTFLFPSALTIILALNGSGKTNILEAIHLLGTSESFRSGTVDDFIQIEQEYGRIKGKVKTEQEETDVEILLTHGNISGKRSAKKIYNLNEVRKTKQKFVGHLPVVSFIPEDLRLITGSPSRRREFLNDLLCQLDPEYLHALTTYDQSLKRRNKLLHLIKEGKTVRTTLQFWDQSILKHGTYLQNQRQKIIAQLNAVAFPVHFEIHYDASVISEERLAHYADTEIAVGHTLIGPHKDDITLKFKISNSQVLKQTTPTTHQPTVATTLLVGNPPLTTVPLFTHGSRGQQRMAVLWLKIGAFELISQKFQHPPLLLLDDIFSELDITNRDRVLQLAKQTQTIMTSAEEVVLELDELKNAHIIRL